MLSMCLETKTKDRNRNGSIVASSQRLSAADKSSRSPTVAEWIDLLMTATGDNKVAGLVDDGK